MDGTVGALNESGAILGSTTNFGLMSVVNWSERKSSMKQKVHMHGESESHGSAKRVSRHQNWCFALQIVLPGLTHRMDSDANMKTVSFPGIGLHASTLAAMQQQTTPSNEVPMQSG